MPPTLILRVYGLQSLSHSGVRVNSRLKERKPSRRKRVSNPARSRSQTTAASEEHALDATTARNGSRLSGEFVTGSSTGPRYGPYYGPLAQAQERPLSSALATHWGPGSSGVPTTDSVLASMEPEEGNARAPW